MVVNHDLGIPAGRNENCVHAAGDRRRENKGNLEADEECKRHNHCCEPSITVICGVREQQIQIGEEGSCEADEHSAEGEDGSEKAFLVNQLVDMMFDGGR